jgi:hypothetical protein
MVREFSQHGLQTDHWITTVTPTGGARVLD